VKISVVIPAYNLSNYIEKTLQSIVASDYSDMEIIVVDDGSTDDTAAVVEEYISEHAQIKLIRQTNQGVSAARNTGIREASGEYIIFVDGDDICAEDMLSSINERVEKETSRPDLIVWGYRVSDSQKNSDVQEIFEKTEYDNCIFLKELLDNKIRVRIGSFAVRRELLCNNNLWFEENCSIGEDVEFIYKSIMCSKDICTISKVLYTYIKRPGSAINNYDLNKFQAVCAVRRIYEFAEKLGIFDGYIMDCLENGMYVTHCMYCFESCIRYIESTDDRNIFWKQYLEKYSDIENRLSKIKKKMQNMPKVFSKKRVYLFLFSRKMYLLFRSISKE